MTTQAKRTQEPRNGNRRPAYWTFDEKADAEHGIKAYYFAPTNRADPPYREQRLVTAVLDIASDGTLAGVELVMGELPPPPSSVALENAEAKVREALEVIQRRAQSDGSRTFDQCIRDLGLIDDHARAALALLDGEGNGTK